MENLSLFQSYTILNEEVNVSLLTKEDYLSASNNLKCINGTEIECIKGNYLTDFSEKNGPEYLLDKNENNIMTINNGLISSAFPTEKLNIRPVLEINKNVKMVGGTGTKENPYTIMAVWK